MPIQESAEETKRLDDWMYAVSHDLHAPVRQVRALVHMLKPEDPAQKHIVALMTGSLERADNMFQGMLEISRVGRVDHPMANHEPASLLETLAGEFELPEGVTLKLPERTPAVRGDRGRLREAVGALIDNALAHGVHGGGSVVVSVSRQGRFAEFRVVDDGEGMTARVLSDAKRLFFTDQLRTTRHCGLGLPLVERIAAAYAGAFIIESTVGHGTTATLLWPLQGPTSVAP